MDTWRALKVLFQSHVHSGPAFTKLLDEEFSSCLRISKQTLGTTKEAFTNKTAITVISPNGRYEIDFKMSEEEVVLEKGWLEFSRAHHLCKTDKLTFYCGCPDIFIVHIHDKNGNSILSGSRSSKTETGKHDKKGRSVGEKGKLNASNLKLSRNRRDPMKKQRCNTKTHEVPSTTQGAVTISLGSSSASTAAKGQISGDKRHGFSVERESATSDSSESEDGDRRVIIQLKRTFISSRREVTDTEKRKALRAAKCFQSATATSRPCFLKVMKETSVYKHFSFVIPVEFARENLPSPFSKISLQMPGRTKKWEVHCRCTVTNAQKLWRVMGGWGQFTFDNSLEEHDVCVFVLKEKDLSQATMNVHIFRVVEDFAPLRVL
ncbi:B3 domain-containing protein [Rhynchospora pubera]|uniref:B3 domain-containing protein n=1 Tax=Rhynchospora pubera TaxID=906938 RepID=A0AAV8DZJ9_9POAL|nr:B3 domain-containing protein [Rhynchospora pubera]